MSICIQQYDNGEVLYIALDPDGIWAKSEFPDELVTVDYNAQGGVIGVELIGSAAGAAANGAFNGFLTSEILPETRADVEAALASLSS